MPELKKKHHYVWKHYLKAWSFNGQVNCIRNGKEFPVSLEGIANKRFFYESIPLGENELKFILELIRGVIPNGKRNIGYILELYTYISKSDNEYDRKCGIEDLHSIIESKFIPILDKLLNNDLSFFNNNSEKDWFAVFIGNQYTRTNKMKSNLLNLDLEKYKINPKIIAPIMSLITAEVVANWIFYESNLTILINESEEKFITSDQPIINIKSDNVVNEKISEFELFYPISPNRAIYLSKEKLTKKEVKTAEVKHFNSMIKKHSKDQLFYLKTS